MKNLDNRNNEPLFNFDSYRMFLKIERELFEKRKTANVAQNMESVVIPGYN